jgi:hypothetical protein
MNVGKFDAGLSTGAGPMYAPDDAARERDPFHRTALVAMQRLRAIFSSSFYCPCNKRVSSPHSNSTTVHSVSCVGNRAAVCAV